MPARYTRSARSRRPTGRRRRHRRRRNARSAPATAMNDALGRHDYAVAAGWAGGRARPDWQRQPTPTIAGGRRCSPATPTTPIRFAAALVRSQEVFAGALLPFRHLRWSETLLAGFDAETDTVTCTGDCRVPGSEAASLRSLRGGWLHDSRARLRLRISPRKDSRSRRPRRRAARRSGRTRMRAPTIFDVRGFRRVFRTTPWWRRARRRRSHGATSPSRRVFSAAGPGPSDPAFDFGRDTIGLLRGFAPEDVVGTRAAVGERRRAFSARAHPARPRLVADLLPHHSRRGASSMPATRGIRHSAAPTSARQPAPSSRSTPSSRTTCR